MIGTNVDLVARQVDEIQALACTFPEEHTLSVDEQACLGAAKAFLEQPDSAFHSSQLNLKEISGRIQIPGLLVEGLPVKLAFQFPLAYPEQAAHFRLECSGPRNVLDEVTLSLNTFSEQQAGQEAVLVCLEEARALLQAHLATGILKEHVETRLQCRIPVALQSDDATIKHAVIWFHHIKSSKKRHAMADWSSALSVGGLSKVGYPGIVILEGAPDAVDEFVTRLRGQQWKAMAVRGEEESEAGEGVDAARRFGRRLEELGEKDLGSMAAKCRAAGLESLFLRALKIDRE